MTATDTPAAVRRDGESLARRRLVAGLNAALGAVLAAVAGLTWTAVFRSEDVVPVVIAGAAVGAVVSLAATGFWGRRPTVSWGLAVVALVVSAPLACGGFAAVTRWWNGPKTILTSGVPVRPDPEVLAVVLVAVGLGSFMGADLAQRSRTTVAPALPSLATLVAGLLFGMDEHLPSLGVPAAWVVGALVTVGWRTTRVATAARVVTTSTVTNAGATGRAARPRAVDAAAQPRAPRGRLLVVLVLALAVAALARSVGPELPVDDPGDRWLLRDFVELGPDLRDMPNMLTQVTTWQGGADTALFAAETSAPVERWRLAVLDTYGPEGWSFRHQLVPAGAELTDPPSRGTAVHQSVDVEGLDVRWLPVADRVVEVSATEVHYDEPAGVVLADSGAVPDRYDASSVVPTVDGERLAGAGAATDAEAQAALQLPEDLPDDLVAMAREVAGAGGGSAYSQAVAIEQYLRTSGRYGRVVDEPRSGHTIGHVRCLLFGDDCAGQGSTEQFVTAYALMARIAGLPARVVVGFEGSGAAGRDEVTAHEATAWVEVRLAGIGWVAFDPSPDPTVEVTPPTTALPGSSDRPPDEATTTTTLGDLDDEADDADRAERAGQDDASLVPLLAGGAVAVVALVLLLPSLIRLRRRRRWRTAPTPQARLGGAWAAALQEMRRGGVHLPPGSAVSDVVAAGNQHYGPAAASLLPLGRTVNVVCFGPEPADDATAAEAWALSDAFAQARQRSRPLGRRLREHFAL
jgi:transglutaminase-like putative cysteine protease